MAFTEDLSVFFSSADFAITAVYDGGTPVNVIFDREFIEPLSGMPATNPVALVQASQIPADSQGKTLEIGGITYVINDRRPQDDGVVVQLQLGTP